MPILFQRSDLLECLVLFLLVALTSILPQNSFATTKIIHLTYEIDGNQALNYWIGPKNLKINFEQDGQRYTLLYQLENETLFTVHHNQKRAIKVSRKFLERTLTRMKAMKERLNEMTPQQRERLKKSNGKVPSLAIKEVPSLRLHNKESLNWKGYSATRAKVYLGSDTETIGNVILLEQPPLEVDAGQTLSLEGFQLILRKLMTLTQSLSSFSGASVLPGQQSFNLMADQLPRIAEYHTPGRSFVLTGWKIQQTNNRLFSVPSAYSVTNLGR